MTTKTSEGWQVPQGKAGAATRPAIDSPLQKHLRDEPVRQTRRPSRPMQMQQENRKYDLSHTFVQM